MGVFNKVSGKQADEKSAAMTPHSAPAGVVAIILVLVTLPRNFPHHGLPPTLPQMQRQAFSRGQLGRVDFLGTTLLLSATVLLVTALEEVGVQYRWKSAFVIVLLVVSALSWIAFFAWSRRITRLEGVREPIFLWKFLESR